MFTFLSAVALASDPYLARGFVAPEEAFPGWSEVSVTTVFDHRYGTRFAELGLQRLVEERARPVPADWTVSDARWVEVLAFDTSGTTPLVLVVDGEELTVFDPGPWTPPTRGYRPGGGGRVDLAALLAAHGHDPGTARFQLAVGGVALTADNTFRLATREGSLLAFNDNGGVYAGDGDCNEPLLLIRGDVDAS